MATISPHPIQETGLRSLTPKEIIQRAKALNCGIAHAAKPSCIAQINVGIFFDGTGNNMESDYKTPSREQRKHSNIVKLFNAYPENPEAGYFRLYIPGVGTPFPAIDDDGTSKFGGAFAWDGENRITWAFTQLLNAPYQYVARTLLLDNDRSKLISGNMASSSNPGFMRRMVLRTWQKTLASNLKGQLPRIELINLSVFGFSRGAAEARAFCNWLFEVCEPVAGGWEFAGIPIRLGFLGIFDTVASVGIPDALSNSIVEGHQSWADDNMQIHPAVEQCVHFVAGHEVRASFPLDSVRVKGVYPPNAKEVMYPGAHSDLGGGYAPNALGIAPQNANEMARIPGAQMYKEARLAGVPLHSWGELLPSDRSDLTVAPKTAADFNAYLKAANIAAGPVEDVHRQHMSLYLSYRYKYRNDNNALPFYRRASAKHKGYLKITSDTFNANLKQLTAYPLLFTDPAYDLQKAVAIHRSFVKAAGLESSESYRLKNFYKVAPFIQPQTLTPVIEDFFANYVHDSMAGFIEMSEKFTNEYKVNGIGIVKFRKIFMGND